MAKELKLKYGCNPNQTDARIYMDEGDLPVKVLNGHPGYINFLDALNGYQLAAELKAYSGLPAAASFKHTSPAGAAVYSPMSEQLAKACFVSAKALSPLATAYVRARGADRMSSYGDFIALSDEVDESTAEYIASVVSDGVIAPGYNERALNILSKKRSGNYTVIKIDKDYIPEPVEAKKLYGITFEQPRNETVISDKLLTNIVTSVATMPKSAINDLVVAMITLKYTQSNSVCYSQSGQAIGIGAGQQSRVHCTRLAGDKADIWQLRQHRKVLELEFIDSLKLAERDNAIDEYISLGKAPADWKTHFKSEPPPFGDEEKREFLLGISGVALASDGFFPFSDNIDRAKKSGVGYIAQPGGSIRDDSVIDACNAYGIAMAFTALRLFYH